MSHYVLVTKHVLPIFMFLFSAKKSDIFEFRALFEYDLTAEIANFPGDEKSRGLSV